MKHPTENHSLFGIDLIDILVEEDLQLDTDTDYDKLWEVHNLSDSEDDIVDLANLGHEAKFLDLLDQVCKYEESECSKCVEVKVAKTKRSLSAQMATIMSTHLVPNLNQVGQSNSKPTNDTSSSPPPPVELKSLSSHLKYAYLGNDQQFPEQEQELLHVLRQHKKNFNQGGSLSNRAIAKKAKFDHPRRSQEGSDETTYRRDYLSHLRQPMVKKELTKLLTVGIIYPILDSQWVSPVQVVPKKFGMTVMKNQHDELATCKDHFTFPFIGQVLEKLVGKSHYCFLDGFSGYMQIHIAPEDQHKTTFTCLFGTFAYTCMPFGLCNVPSTFQRCMTSIFSYLLQNCMEVFMDDFMVYATSFDACLENLSKVLARCIDTNLMLNFEKSHFMVVEGIMFGHLVSSRGIEVDKSKINMIISLPNPISGREVRSFLRHDANFKFDQPYVEAFQELKTRLTSTPILQAPNWEQPFELMCDASNSTLRAVLDQRAEISKQMHELLAIVFALDKFCSYLLGSKIIIFSNHAPLRFLLKKPDAKPRLIRDKKGAENLVADHLSQIERESNPMPIQDEFPNEQLLQMNTFHKRHPVCTKKNLIVRPNTTYGMIHIFEDSAIINSFIGAFRTLRSIRSSNFVTQHLQAATMDQLGQPRKCLIVGFIGSPFSEALINLSPSCSVKFSMCGVLILWGHSQFSMDTLCVIFYTPYKGLRWVFLRSFGQENDILTNQVESQPKRSRPG
ncbi:Retrovirus-related Pol polyprotein, partial [Mucuna pruriens]